MLKEKVLLKSLQSHDRFLLETMKAFDLINIIIIQSPTVIKADTHTSLQTIPNV